MNKKFIPGKQFSKIIEGYKHDTKTVTYIRESETEVEHGEVLYRKHTGEYFGANGKLA